MEHRKTTNDFYFAYNAHLLHDYDHDGEIPEGSSLVCPIMGKGVVGTCSWRRVNCIGTQVGGQRGVTSSGDLDVLD